MSQTQNKSIIQPGLSDVLMNLKMDILGTLRVAMVGKINSFDASKQTAQIKVMSKMQLSDGTYKDYPLLIDCPVFTPQGGGGSLMFPIAAGDECLVIFADRRVDEWFKTGDAQVPADGRMHELSDGIAIVGLNSLARSISGFPTNKVLLTYQGSTVELDASGIKLIGEGGAEIDLQSTLITIKNGTTTLLTLLNGLIDVLTALQVNGPIPLTAASIAALNAYKTTLAGLLA